MALVGVERMAKHEMDPNLPVTSATWSWLWILDRMDESVQSLGAEAPQQGIQYVTQIREQATQLLQSPTRENYNVFLMNAKQVAAALGPILESTGRLPLGSSYLPAPMRG